MYFAIEKCALLIMKRGKRYRTEGMELPNQDKTRTLEENETNKYLGILIADTIKDTEVKEKVKKKNSGEQKNYLKPNNLAEISSKNKFLGCPTRKILGTFLRMNKRRTPSNGLENQETHDDE